MPICDRCHKETTSWTMSMFNEQEICMDCKDKERARPDYKQAQEAERAQVQQGNYNYKGIGY